MRGQGGKTKPDQGLVAEEAGVNVVTVSSIWSKHFAVHCVARPTMPDRDLETEDEDFDSLARRTRAILAHRLRLEERRIAMMEDLIDDEVAMSTIAKKVGPSQTRELKDLAIVAGVLADKAAAAKTAAPRPIVHQHPSKMFESPGSDAFPAPPKVVSIDDARKKA